ncbi:MAG: hypothetical protein M0Z32_07280 [Actinomycetota bacterium]|nr:hypothetical protein [Actinomycetota bacterium]MCL6092518.1 hypothetical protein [Actinomycetota bacterium]MDA8167529.1 hypothetical protein [Actinomycetota bacterium]
MAEKDDRINNETEETGNGSRRADRRRSWYKNPFLLVGLAAFLIVIAAAGVLAVKLRGSTGSDAQAAVTTGTGTTSDNIVDSPFSSTSQQIAAMSVEEKVGQMMMVGFSGKSVDDSLRKLITADHVGNVVIDAGNVDSDQQVAALAASLQQLAVSANQPARMMIAAAQEGGKTRLFQNIGPNYSEPFIGNMRGGAGAIASQQTASEAARQLKRIGINTDLTPDADVTIGWQSIIDTRSYGNDPQVVAELTGAAVKGYNNATTISCTKYFPGLGSAETSPEKKLPTIHSDRATIDSQDLPPFREAIKDGAPMIMVADVAYPALDPSRTPASLSRPIMTDLLRGQLGFQGVIITDDLGMAAISQKPGDAAVAAIAAGADIVMFADTPDKQQQAYDAIVAAVRSGKLSEDQINKSVERILDMKKKYRLERPEASAGINTGTSTGAGGQ